MARRIIFPEKGQVRLDQFDPPPPGAGEVLVRTQYSLMSIGTETTILHQRYDPGTHFAARFSFPQLKTGVQAVARIEAIGADVSGIRAGDLIYMRMAHTSHWTLPAAQCSPVPDGIDLKQACWCGLAKTAFRAAYAAPFRLGGDVLVVGAGPVGQMTLRWAKCAGMRRIVVVDLSQLRLNLAASGGATAGFRGALHELHDALRGVSGGSGFDLIVDTTGNPVVFAGALRLAGDFGKLVLLGDTGYPSRQCLTSDAMTRGLTIVATHDHHDRGGWTQRRIDELFFQLVGNRSFHLESLITHEFPPDKAAEAYALASDHRDDAVGVLFDWTGD